MFQTHRILAALAASTLLSFAAHANAAMMNHGDFVADTVTFVDVTENNIETNLFYDDFSSVGDTLLFDPNGFAVQVSPGPGSSLLDSELEMMISANDGYALTSLQFDEAGDYTLSGDGSINASIPYFWEIVEVDGVAVAPITGSGQTSFVAGVSGTGIIWGLDFDINIDHQLTIAEATMGEIGTGVTKLNLRFDNSLTATANNASSVAFIKKKQVGGITVNTHELVPEPNSLGMILLGLAGLMIKRR